jgi:GT2 family glycosyltransferase/glycosyltransferase involved in cell wall biosynthesis
MTKKSKKTNIPVTIIIPTINNSDLTLQCVMSIFETETSDIYKEIIVVDNGSRKEEFEKFNILKNKARIINLTTNHGYGQAINVATQIRMEGSDVIVLNNDTTMTKGWLKELQNTAYSKREYGIIGPIMLYNNQQIQSSGGFLTSLGWGNHTHDMPNEIREVEYCPGACLYIKNDLIEKLGNKIFDETFFPAYSEDVWLGYEARSKDYISVISPNSIVYHLEGMTSKNNSLTEYEKNELNKAKLLNRDKLYKKIENIDYSDKKKKYQLSFIGSVQGGWSYVTVLRNLTKALDKTKNVDVAIYDTNYHGYQGEHDWHLSKMMNKKKNIKDRICVRYGEGSTLFLSAGKKKIGYTTHESVTTIPRDWVEQLNQMDQVWTTTEFVKHVFKNSGVKQEIFVIPHGINFDEFNPKIKPAKLSYLKGFVFYVNNIYGPRKNIDHIIAAYTREFTSDDNVSLLLKCNFNDMLKPRNTIDYFSQFQRPDGKNPKIELIESWVDIPTLAKLYRRADCFIGIGNEGFGLTNMEAMACGKPCIAPSWGGLTEFCNKTNSLILEQGKQIPARQDFLYKQYANTSWVIPNLEELQEKMRFAYENPIEMNILGKKSYETVKHMTWDYCASRCIEALDTL